jgi:hypothetical protein
MFVVAGVIAGHYIGYDRIARKLGIGSEAAVVEWRAGEEDFPTIDTAGFTATQQQLLVLTQQEFLAQPAGTRYSEGASEAWCANFVSWVMKEAGEPLENPHSGSWRIPGTFTLKEYYESQDRFRSIDSGYEPKLGDVAVYRRSPVFGDHANIVLISDGGVLTTVGGNEGDRVRIYKNTEKNYQGLLGYGVLHGQTR